MWLARWKRCPDVRLWKSDGEITALPEATSLLAVLVSALCPSGLRQVPSYAAHPRFGYHTAMAALPDLITVTQFPQLSHNDAYRYELRHGEVVAVTRPKARHWRLQVRLSRLLERKLKAFGEVGMELPFRPLPEFEWATSSHSRHSVRMNCPLPGSSRSHFWRLRRPGSII